MNHPSDSADENLLQSGKESVEKDDTILHLVDKKRHPHAFRLVLPHGNIEPEEGKAHESSGGMSAWKGPPIDGDDDEMATVVLRSRSSHDLFDDGNEDEIELERHEKVEEKGTKLRGELGSWS